MKENSLAKNKKWVTAAAIYGCVFALMLFCNRMSSYVVDDFQYMFSFYDNERIGSLYPDTPEGA